MQSQENNSDKIMFMHLVSMLAMSAIQQMGKLVDPSTGKTAINLEAAQATIDILDMLEIKTRGNLDAEETRLLKDTLMSLKMNYVESQDQKADGGNQPTGGGAKKAERSAEDGIRKTEDGPAKTEDGTRKATEEDKTPKYHKKYE